MSYRLLAARRFSPVIAATLAVVASVGSAHAAIVSWSVPTNIFNDSDVSLSRNFVAAYNIGDGGIADGASTATHGHYNVTSSCIYGGLPINTSADYDSAALPFTSLSTAYQSLLRSQSHQNRRTSPCLA